MSEEHAVSLKLPTFWSSQPEVWFAQAEAQFNLRIITADDTKYYYVLAALDQPTATRLLDRRGGRRRGEARVWVGGRGGGGGEVKHVCG